MPISCAGMPAVARRMICGGVRTESRELDAPPSARSVAISAPEFPAPTTSTSRPRYGSGIPVLRRVDELAGKPVAAGPVGDPRSAVVARRHDHRLGAQRPVREGEQPAVARRGRSARPRCRSARRAAPPSRSPGDTRSRRRGRPSVRSGAGSACPAGRRAAAACAGAAGRSARARRRRAPALPPARAARGPRAAAARRSPAPPSRRRRSRRSRVSTCGSYHPSRPRTPSNAPCACSSRRNISR